jgi:hypothetical protein
LIFTGAQLSVALNLRGDFEFRLLNNVEILGAHGKGLKVFFFNYDLDLSLLEPCGGM